MKRKEPETKPEGESRAYALVLSYLEQQIRKGDLKLGDKLPSERTLMGELGLGRNSVREGLRQLENMGFIHSAQGQGSFLVNEADRGISGILSVLLLLDQTSRAEFFSLRQSLEQGALDRMVQQEEPEVLRRMEKALSAMEASPDGTGWEAAERVFHWTLITGGRNHLSETLVHALTELDDAYRQETLAGISEETRRRLLDAHRAMVQALREKDREKGRLALEEHFQLICGT